GHQTNNKKLPSLGMGFDRLRLTKLNKSSLSP
ncbi:MAG: hypothetical protein ACI828_001617, partial [Flavobacteriales bacterium]